MLLALLGLHAVLAAAAPAVSRRLGRGVFAVCAVAPAATVAYALARAPAAFDGAPASETVAWAGRLGLDLQLRLDAFAVLMVLLVSGIGVLIFAYCAWYFGPRPDLGRFAATLLAFAGSMLGVVLADNVLVLYVFWELTTVTSYLLIGFDHEKGSARAAALQGLLVTAAGGLAMLAGLVVLGEAAGTYTLSAMLADPPAGGAATAGALLALGGAFTKSAQVPFHFWLAGAMAAPTPVSAYLHSATMVKAGVYLVARLAPAFALLGGWRELVVGVGVATMLLGGWRALRQHDLKLLLAYGTVSQLGFMMILLGAGVPEATRAGAVLLLAHGAFKAALFMVVGIVDHQAGTRDLRRLSGLGRRMPATFWVAVVAAASMAGLPPLFGFVAKEAAFEAYLHGGIGPIGPIALGGMALGSVLTFAYSARFVWGAFADKPDVARAGHDGAGAHAPPAAFLAPAALLAVVTVAIGVLPSFAAGLVNAAAAALDPAVEPGTLALWHGFNLALWLSALVIVAGVALFARRREVEHLQARLPSTVDAARAYHGLVKGLNRGADRVTGLVQNGSLPVYLGTILLTVVALPLPALLSGGLPTPDGVVAESLLQLAVIGGVAVAAIGTVLARRRFAAVLFLGGVGYGVAILFVIQGAPDLALTQLLVETLSLVVFVLVLRHLPENFEVHHWRLGQAFRRAVAGLVGVFVFVFVLAAGQARTSPPVSEAYLAQALPEAGGRNVVNVILVDFRGFDTLGEITVLAVAALGIAGLVRARRRERGDEEPA